MISDPAGKDVDGRRAIEHTFGVPPPPQTWPDAQVPQLSVPPQVSPTVPQLVPSWAHVFGTQATQTLLTQVSVPVQEAPQLVVPHAVLTVPQFLPAHAAAFTVASVAALQPHWLAVPPPPQVCDPPLQVPQLANVVPVQLSVGVPQLALSEAQVEGVQQVLLTPQVPLAHWPLLLQAEPFGLFPANAGRGRPRATRQSNPVKAIRFATPESSHIGFAPLENMRCCGARSVPG
jgi:hypothetical protein